MRPEQLINKSELSRLLGLNRSSTSANRMSKKNRAKVDRLIKLIEKWYRDEFPDNGA